MKMDVSESAAPAKILIPEAWEHRRRRYRRSGIGVVLAVLALAGLVVATVLLFAGSSTTGSPHRAVAPATGSRAPGVVYFRPVLRFAPPYDPSQASSAALGPPSCSAASALTSQNLATPDVHGAAGFTIANVLPDSALAGVPSTRASAETPKSTCYSPVS